MAAFRVAIGLLACARMLSLAQSGRAVHVCDARSWHNVLKDVHLGVASVFHIGCVEVLLAQEVFTGQRLLLGVCCEGGIRGVVCEGRSFFASAVTSHLLVALTRVLFSC